MLGKNANYAKEAADFDFVLPTKTRSGRRLQ